MPGAQFTRHSLGAGVGAIEGGGVGAGVAVTENNAIAEEYLR